MLLTLLHHCAWNSFLSLDRLTRENKKKNENESAICEFKNYFSCAIKCDGKFFRYNSDYGVVFGILLWNCGISVPTRLELSTVQKNVGTQYWKVSNDNEKKVFSWFLAFCFVCVEIWFDWKQKKKLTMEFHAVQLFAIITWDRNKHICWTSNDDEFNKVKLFLWQQSGKKNEWVVSTTQIV